VRVKIELVFWGFIFGILSGALIFGLIIMEKKNKVDERVWMSRVEYEREKGVWMEEFKRMVGEINKGEEERGKLEDEIKEMGRKLKDKDKQIEKKEEELKVVEGRLGEIAEDVRRVEAEFPVVREMRLIYEERIEKMGEIIVGLRDKVEMLEGIDMRRKEEVEILKMEMGYWRRAYERERRLREMGEEVCNNLIKRGSGKGEKVFSFLGKVAVVGGVVYAGYKIIK